MVRDRTQTELGRGGRGGARLAGGGLATLAIYQCALGAYFLALRPGLLPEDLRLLQISAAPAPLARWLHFVFAVLGGQMIAVGFLLVPVASALWSGARLRRMSFIVLIVAGLASVGLMSAVNFALGSDFRWALTAPAELWAVVAVAVWRSGLDTKERAEHEASARN